MFAACFPPDCLAPTRLSGSSWTFEKPSSLFGRTGRPPAPRRLQYCIVRSSTPTDAFASLGFTGALEGRRIPAWPAKHRTSDDWPPTVSQGRAGPGTAKPSRAGLLPSRFPRHVQHPFDGSGAASNRQHFAQEVAWFSVVASRGCPYKARFAWRFLAGALANRAVGRGSSTKPCRAVVLHSPRAPVSEFVVCTPRCQFSAARPPWRLLPSQPVPKLCSGQVSIWGCLIGLFGVIFGKRRC